MDIEFPILDDKYKNYSEFSKVANNICVRVTALENGIETDKESVSHRRATLSDVNGDPVESNAWWRLEDVYDSLEEIVQNIETKKEELISKAEELDNNVQREYERYLFIKNNFDTYKKKYNNVPKKIYDKPSGKNIDNPDYDVDRRKYKNKMNTSSSNAESVIRTIQEIEYKEV